MAVRQARITLLAALAVAGCDRCTTKVPSITAVRSLPSDPSAARQARDELVARIAARHPEVSSRVLDAMRAVPRHWFLDGGTSIDRAYADRPLPIGWDQTISQPSVVAVMTDALELEPTHRVLEIGTGSGYQAAVLSKLAAHVDTIEIVAALADAARPRLASLGYANVEVRTGDGYKGWPERAPYDRILLTAAPPEVPRALFDQLAEGGVLVAPAGERGAQRLFRWKKRGGRLVEEDLGAVVFVPMVH